MNESGYFYYISNLLSIFSTQNFQGWGRKRSGKFALWCHQQFAGELTLFEDGFMRSVDFFLGGVNAIKLRE